MGDANEFIITRTFNAPRMFVWKALTEAERLRAWWGPKGFTVDVCNADVRTGGVFHYSLHSPGGVEMWGKFVYLEVEEPSHMIFVNSFSDAAGGITRHPWSTTWPLEVVNALTLTLTEEAGKTVLTLESSPVNATKEEAETFIAGRAAMQQGFSETWDKLDRHLAEAQR